VAAAEASASRGAARKSAASTSAPCPTSWPPGRSRAGSAASALRRGLAACSKRAFLP